MDGISPELKHKSVPYHHQPTGTKLIRNSLFGALRILVVAPIPLLLTPFIIKHVGTRGFGVWAIFTALNALTSLADFGLLGTLTKHVSQHFTNRDYGQLTQVINAGLVIFAGLATVCFGLLRLGGTMIISNFFRQAPWSFQELLDAFHWVTVAIAINLVTFPFASVITGLQRFDVTYFLSALNLAGTACLVAIFLSFGFAIQGLAYSIVVSSALNLLLNIFMAKRLLPELRFAPHLVRLPDVKSLSLFSAQLYIVQISVVVSSQAEKFLLAHFTGLTPAGWFEIANDLASRTRSISSLFLSPLLPASTELETRGDDLKVAELYSRAQKYLALLNVPIFTAIALLAPRFISLWLGPGFSAAATALTVLTGSGFITVATAPGIHILTAKGSLQPGVRAASLGVVLNLAISTVLIFSFGFAGAVYGTASALIIASLYFLMLFHRQTHYPLSKLISHYIKPALSAGLLASSIHFLISLNHFGWTGLIVTLAVFLAAYLIGLVLLRYFDVLDLQVLERVVPLPKLLRKIVLVA